MGLVRSFFSQVGLLYGTLHHLEVVDYHGDLHQVDNVCLLVGIVLHHGSFHHIGLVDYHDHVDRFYVSFVLTIILIRRSI